MKLQVFADPLRSIKSDINELARFQVLAASKMPRWIHLFDDSRWVDLEGRTSDRYSIRPLSTFADTGEFAGGRRCAACISLATYGLHRETRVCRRSNWRG
jgi:hypothetical protein